MPAESGRLDEQGVDGPDPGDGVEEDREEDPQKDDEGGRSDPDAEPEDGDGDPRQGRDGAEDLHQGREQAVKAPGPPQEDPQRHGGGHGDGEAGPHPEQAVEDVVVEGMARRHPQGRQVPQAQGHLDGGGQFVGRDQAQGADPLPDEQARRMIS